MVHRIYDVKNRVLEFLDHEVQEGSEHIDIETVGMLADIVKDLAHAEKNCWEAEYYHSIVDAMEKSDRAGYGSGRSYSRMGNRSGWHYGSGYSRKGYSDGHEDAVEHLIEAMKGMDEEEKMRARERLLSAMDS